MLTSDELRTGLTAGWPWHDWELPAGGLYRDLRWLGKGDPPSEERIAAELAAVRTRAAEELKAEMAMAAACDPMRMHARIADLEKRLTEAEAKIEKLGDTPPSRLGVAEAR